MLHGKLAKIASLKETTEIWLIQKKLFNRGSGLRLSWAQYAVTNKIANQEGGPGRVSTWLHPPALTSSRPTMSQQSGQEHIWCRLICKVFGILDNENKRWLSKCWFTWEQEMALKTLVYMRTRDSPQNYGLHENKRWLSKLWFTW
jgi:hypothetical protein